MESCQIIRMAKKFLSFLYKSVLTLANMLVYLGLAIIFPFEKILALAVFLSKRFVQQISAVKIKRIVFVKPKLRALSWLKSPITSIKLPKVKLKKGIKLAKKFVRPYIIGKPAYFVYGTFFSLLFVVAPYNVYTWYRQLPQPILLAQTQNKSTRILDRNGRMLFEIYVDRQYNPVALTSVPKYMVDATLAVEDSSFYGHIGIRPFSMLRAAKATLVDDTLQGGSTITQQLVKNVLLSPERTFGRKLKEIVLALMVERTYTKDKILELYLNNIAYGGTAWGVQSAAQKYFGKDISQIDLAEAGLLAGLPSAPSVYSPFMDKEVAKQRQKIVLDRMTELGFITKEQSDEAFARELVFVLQTEYIRAPHFVNHVQNELIDLYGKRMVYFGGLTIKTTLDLDIQEKVQTIVTDEVEKSGPALNISNGATAVLDAKSGGILAYVGSKDYFSQKDGNFDVLTASRQPGSSIKPVTYALALASGRTPATVIEDSPVSYSAYGQTYSPVNYDGKFHGKVTLRQALANSYNVPAVKLLRSLGVEKMVELGTKMGLTTWQFDNTFGLSVTLGGKEVRPLDLVNVYATLARGGEYAPVAGILSVTDANGFEIYEADGKRAQVVDGGVAYLISHILSDNNARAAAFGYNSELVVPGYTVAVKTGTTDAKRDNWTLGYTPSYVVGVWVGNNDNTPMNPSLASGLSGAAPIWNKIMRSVLDGKQNEPFVIPSTVFVKVDKECQNASEVFLNGTAPKNLCAIKKDDKSERR